MLFVHMWNDIWSVATTTSIADYGVVLLFIT